MEFETPVKGPEQVPKLLPRSAGARPGVHDRTKEAMDPSRPWTRYGLTEDKWRQTRMYLDMQRGIQPPWQRDMEWKDGALSRHA